MSEPTIAEQIDAILNEPESVKQPQMPAIYDGLADKDRLRKLADELGEGDPATMLRLVAKKLEDAEEKPPLPAKWGGIEKGQLCPSSKRRFMEIIGEERLTYLATHDHRILALERKIRELEESVSGNDGIVAKAWREASTARKAYMDAHLKRETIWRRIVLLRSDQRLRMEKLMRDELSERVDKIRLATNRTMIKAPAGSNKKWDRRGATRIHIVPPDMDLTLPLTENNNDNGGDTTDGEATSQ